ncbi:MAG: hypothetical protein QMD36_05785 [Candidatus Aenigmarchaeota archaeon]|nr:hypothetical protein [Candidatus Aenigmarchaeota archaeon]
MQFLKSDPIYARIVLKLYENESLGRASITQIIEPDFLNVVRKRHELALKLKETLK